MWLEDFWNLANAESVSPYALFYAITDLVPHRHFEYWSEYYNNIFIDNGYAILQAAASLLIKTFGDQHVARKRGPLKH